MTNSEQKRGRKRPLAPHEVELWEHVTRCVAPMRPRPKSSIPEATANRQVPPASPVRVAAPKAQPTLLKPLASLEPTTRRRLSRGQKQPEAKIDLHGMRQAEAHSALRAFVHRAHSDGLRLILVVTGKGVEATGAALYEERGVLRRMTPQWLAAPDLRHLVLSFEEASRRHGGHGAFYVQLRASNVRRSVRGS